jgi:quinoprotein glucose dehydrogenase
MDSKMRAMSLLLSLTVPLAAIRAESPATIDLSNPPASLNTSPLEVEVVELVPDLRIERPVVITHPGDGTDRIVIGSQYGQIYCVPNTNTPVEPHLVVDLSDRVQYDDQQNEEGMLGIAFHPQVKQNRQVFVYYTTRAAEHTSIISRFTIRSLDPLEIDPSSEQEIMRIPQPFWNHNGGTIVFGGDGFLYVGLGDGGAARDPFGNGQNLATLLGSILRIDVDRHDQGKNYAIPSDNPFIGKPDARPEIWAYGLRNVWRIAFDPANGDLWAADVGQDLWEEVNLIRAGQNYGWNQREAAHPFLEGASSTTPLVDPLIEYPHKEGWGVSVTGGAVYRSPREPKLNGYYLYGDYVSGRLWALKLDPQSQQVVENRSITWEQLPVFTFGQLADGEVVMSTMSGGGRLYRFVSKR